MPAPYSGNPTGIQAPSPQPVAGGVPIFNIPVPGDRGADLWSQPLKTAADWIAFFAAQPLLVPSGQLLRTSVLTSGTSLVKIANCRRAHVRMVGGGGGGAGAGINQYGGGGGAAGGYAEFFTNTIPATWFFSIGAGGLAGSFVPTDGGSGGNTTFSDGATLVTAFGGGGGGILGPGQSPAISTNGTINGSGEPGGTQDRVTSGRGGSSLLGGAGGPPVGNDVDSDGSPGTGYGAGGSGGYRFVTNASGGAGTAGAIILEEYS